MPTISYHASHEQFAPSELLLYAKLAEHVGFSACHSSDHFHPWSERQGQSGFSFAWLGALLEATSFPVSLVVSPGQRYHPAIVAQAIGTLAEMYPRRLEVALGSGEAINESITGQPWPNKSQRNQRLKECWAIIKRLLEGETISFDGSVQVKKAKLYTRPQALPKLMCAAYTEESAEWAGEWADGLLTVHADEESLKKVINAFRASGGEGKPIHVQMAFSYARDESVAVMGAYDQWRSNLIGVETMEDCPSVSELDEKGEEVSVEQVRANLVCTSKWEILLEMIERTVHLGASNVILHNVNREQKTFIEDFGVHVLPIIGAEHFA